MSVFLLWFHEWEASYVLGVFESQEQAELWKQYFIKYPDDKETSMEHYKGKDDYEDRFAIEVRTVGHVSPIFKVDNLKFLELQLKDVEINVNGQKTTGTEPA